MPVQFTEKDVMNELKLYGFKLVSKYRSSQENITVIDQEGYLYTFRHCIIINALRRGVMPSFVIKFNKNSFENIRLWVQTNISYFEVVKGKYLDSKQRTIILKCSTCTEEWIESWENILIGQGCPFCARKRVSEFNNLQTDYPELMEEWDYVKNKTLPSDYFPKSNKSVWWICSLCSNSYFTQISNRTQKDSSCPKCCESKGEKSISKWLTDNGIKNIQEFRFENCRDKRPLPFDFYLPDYNVCIEYDGEQHHTTRTNFFGGKEKLEELKRRDKIKTKYCKDNDMFLLRIPHWDFENIEQILTETLFS